MLPSYLVCKLCPLKFIYFLFFIAVPLTYFFLTCSKCNSLNFRIIDLNNGSKCNQEIEKGNRILFLSNFICLFIYSTLYNDLYISAALYQTKILFLKPAERDKKINIGFPRSAA